MPNTAEPDSPALKLASLRHDVEGRRLRDGRLVLVSTDLSRATDVTSVAPTLQAALDDWARAGPRLAALAESLEHGGLPDFRFRERDCASPLPRAHQWADGAAYLNHVEVVRRARGAALPEQLLTDPLLHQGGSDAFLDPRAPIIAAEAAWDVDFEAEIAVVTTDVPAGIPADEAGLHIALIMLVNDISLRNLIADEIAKGFGFFQSKPSSAFSPVAVTPDALGAAWDGRKLSLPLLSSLNGAPFGRPDAGRDIQFDFPALIAHAAKTRPLGAGTIIGSGAVSNRDEDGGPGRPVTVGGVGYSCLAEQRAIETIERGAPVTAFLGHGDVVRIEMRDRAGRSIFGAIEQTVKIGE